jgi:transposase
VKVVLTLVQSCINKTGCAVSYPQLISILEYGYNRDGINLPQVDLFLIMDREISGYL